MKNKPELENAIFEFTQEANCLSRNDEFETLEVTYASSLGLDKDGEGFFILKTDSWSIDNVEELRQLFTRIEKIMINETISK